MKVRISEIHYQNKKKSVKLETFLTYLLGGGTIWGKWGSWTVNAFLRRIFLGGGLSPMARSDKSVARPFIWLEDNEWKYVVGDTTWFTRPPLLVVCSDISKIMENQTHQLAEIQILLWILLLHIKEGIKNSWFVIINSPLHGFDSFSYIFRRNTSLSVSGKSKQSQLLRRP